MLIVERKHNESIIIDGNIKVTVIMKNGKVRLGIDAHPDIVVDREEIHQRKLRERGEFNI